MAMFYDFLKDFTKDENHALSEDFYIYLQKMASARHLQESYMTASLKTLRLVLKEYLFILLMLI